MVDLLFIGDDFTGASDSLAAYARFGWRTRLLIDRTPTGKFATALDAPGIPTDLRSLDPDTARREIKHLWPTVEALDPRIIHYKVCSTFDSSANTGSIGANVAEIAGRFRPDVLAVIGGQPSLRRYCAFGNLFASAHDGKIYRIDRHPVMSIHPVTPMTEGNLMTHLAAQGLDGLQAAFLPDLSDHSMLVARLRESPVFFDAVTERDLSRIGLALETVGGRQLLVGASSVAEAIASGSTKGSTPAIIPPPISDRLFIFAGSRSSGTLAQIGAATAYRIVELDPAALRNGAGLAEAERLLCADHAVLAHLVPGANYGTDPSDLADLSAVFVRTLLDRVDIGYLGVAGGDTSSRICGKLGIAALDFWRAIGPGVCVCTAKHSSTGRMNMRLLLKGGQMGDIDIFDRYAALRTSDWQA